MQKTSPTSNEEYNFGYGSVGKILHNVAGYVPGIGIIAALVRIWKSFTETNVEGRPEVYKCEKARICNRLRIVAEFSGLGILCLIPDIVATCKRTSRSAQKGSSSQQEGTPYDHKNASKSEIDLPPTSTFGGMGQDSAAPSSSSSFTVQPKVKQQFTMVDDTYPIPSPTAKHQATAIRGPYVPPIPIAAVPAVEIPKSFDSFDWDGFYKEVLRLIPENGVRLGKSKNVDQTSYELVRQKSLVGIYFKDVTLQILRGSQGAIAVQTTKGRSDSVDLSLLATVWHDLKKVAAGHKYEDVYMTFSHAIIYKVPFIS